MNIYTLTPNPAMDLSGHVSKLVANEKNYVEDERRDPGGNGINAARIIHRLGGKTITMGFLGGSTGDEVLSLLKREGVAASFTPIKNCTRTNVTVTNDADHKQTRLTFPGPAVSKNEIRALLESIRKLAKPGIMVIGGSMPQGCPPEFHNIISKAASQRGLGIVIDVPGKFISSVTNSRISPLLIKPNLAELEHWRKTPLRTDNLIIAAAKTLAAKSAIVCVSLAERGAILISGSCAWFGKAPKVKARGTVGAGDSMVGAMVTQMAKFSISSWADVKTALSRQDYAMFSEILAWGIAAGAATAEARGTALADVSEIFRLRKQVVVNPIAC